MVMDPNFRSFIVSESEHNSLEGSDSLLNRNRNGNRYHFNDTQGQSSEGDSPEDFDFSDAVLKYINHILMEEDMEDKACMFLESAALQSAEKSFYDVLEEKQHVSTDNLVPRMENPDAKFTGELRNNFGVYDTETLCPDWISDPNKGGFDGHYRTVNAVSQSVSYSSSSSSGTIIDGPMDSPVSSLKVPDIFSERQSAIQFKKGVEEASRFLPNSSNFMVNLSYDESSEHKSEGPMKFVVKVENKFDNEESKGKKNSYDDIMGFQDKRSNKQSAVYTESTVSSDMFDKVLLCSEGKNDSDLRKALNEVTLKSNLLQGGQLDGVKTKSRGKKQGIRKNVVDMRSLLTLCAQAVAADDRRTANEFLKQIRQHSTPNGDGMQRLAHYFADGLKARMSGSGTQSLIHLPTHAADILKAYHIYLATCPFRKISHFFANKIIMNVAEEATSLHIIDFGILYGFQWPCFLQRLSSRPGGPPKLRITGIDFPCPGFRPSQRVAETGRRLASYAETFKVPFEFVAIAQKWETIKIEDLKIRKDEVLVVNCLYRFRNLLDETVIVNSPRNMVLNLIRKMNPSVFVLGIVNGAYNAPFFITRFREALFHYSSFFDMLDANIPREVHERMLLERTVFGCEAMNVIACEGAERIERPETYKQWQVRNLRAGFKQFPLDKEIMKIATNRVKSSYHKNFVIDEDRQWMLQGWKGRIVYALSSWRPAY